MDPVAWSCVLFDMDGTLLDSTAAIERAWTTIAVEAGLDVSRLLAIHAGRTAPSTLRELLPLADDATVARLAARQLALQYDDLHDVRLLPGAAALLARLDRRRVPWAIVTSADRRLASARLGAVGIDPDVLVTADEVTRGKPDPEGYLRAASQIGHAPSACLVVEDAPSGVAAGRAAGAAVVGLGRLESDWPVDDLIDLDRRLAIEQGCCTFG